MKFIFSIFCALVITLTNSIIYAASIYIESYDEECVIGKTAKVEVSWTDILPDGYKIILQLENWDVQPAVLLMTSLTEFESSGSRIFKIDIPEDAQSVEDCRFVAAVLSETSDWADVQCVSDTLKNVNIVKGLHEELQWKDFGDKTIEFSGYTWRIKEGGIYGPGTNYFSASSDNIWVDEKGWLHLHCSDLSQHG